MCFTRVEAEDHAHVVVLPGGQAQDAAHGVLALHQQNIPRARLDRPGALLVLDRAHGVLVLVERGGSGHGHHVRLCGAPTVVHADSRVVERFEFLFRPSLPRIGGLVRGVKNQKRIAEECCSKHQYFCTTFRTRLVCYLLLLLILSTQSEK